MSPAVRARLAGGWCAALLAACAGPRPAPAPASAPNAAPAPVPGESYDWRPLISVPFGSLLRDVPGLHEVLLFGEPAAAGEGAPECFAPATAPLVLGLAPQRYALCFAHDRLARVEAAARLPTERAASWLARACAAWHAAADAAGCRGEDRGIRVDARIEAQADPADALLTLVLAPAEAGVSEGTPP